MTGWGAAGAAPRRRGRAFGVTTREIEWPEDVPTVNTYAGETVTPETALRLTAVWACMRVLSETIGSLPLHVYEKSERGPTRKQRVSDHPLYFLVHNEPNGEMDSAQWRELTVLDLCGDGNSYQFIERDPYGTPTGLFPLSAGQVTQRRDDRRGIVYDVLESGSSRRTLPAERVWHPMILPRLTNAGLKGRSPIRACRQAIGLGLGTEQYGARLFANDSRTSGVLQVEGRLGKNEDEARAIRKLMQDEWTAGRTGENRHRIAILDQGMKYQAISINPDDAQFLETRKFQLSEIARIFRVPPHMIADLDKATFSNIEHQAIEFVMHTIRPYLVKLEQSMNRVLLTREEKGRLFIEFNVEGLLRGDTLSRYRAYAIARQWGWLSVNDIRDLENLNPVDGGDEYLKPLNMVGLGEDPAAAGNDGRSGTLPESEGGDAGQTAEDRRAAAAVIRAYTAFCGHMNRLQALENLNGNGCQS